MRSDFLDDVYEKSAIAKSASKRVGNTRKAAVLPCDRLTNLQIPRLSGPVITYKLSPDITPEELATWPADLQKMWRKKFGGDAE